MKRLSLIKILCAISLICISVFCFTACGKTDESANENAFTITAETSSYGVINIRESAKKGQTVSFTALPKKGYSVNAVYLNGVQLNSNSFTMPDSNVYLSAVYSADDGYEIITEDDEYGVISANPVVANAGDKVTLKTYVSYGKEVDYYTVNGEKISGNEFTMPSGNATVAVALKDLFNKNDVVLTVESSSIKAKSHWSAVYGEKSLIVNALVEDSVVFTQMETQPTLGYLDNAEFIIGRKSTNENSFNQNNYRFLVAANGRYLCYVASNGYWNNFGGEVKIETKQTNILFDGYAGYKVSVEIPYISLGLTRRAALNEITFACSLRNTINGIKTNWGYYSEGGIEWENPATHLLITENGFTKDETPEKTNVLLIGGGIFDDALGGGLTKNLSLLGKTMSIAKSGSSVNYWTENLDKIAEYAPNQVLFAPECDLENGVLSAFNDTKAFIDAFNTKYPEMQLTVVSAIPSRSLTADNEAIKAYNSSLEDYAKYINLKYVDVFSDLYDGSPYAPAFSGVKNLSYDGYAYLNKKILTAFGKYYETSGEWGDYGMFVQTDGAYCTPYAVGFNKSGVQETHLRQNAGKDFIYAVSFTVNSNISGDEWPKFGLSIKNRNKSVYLYVDGSAGLTSTNVGTVEKINGVYDWSTSQESSSAPWFSYVSGNYVELKVEKTGNVLALYVNGSKVIIREFDFGDGDCVVGIFDFSLNLTAKNWSLEKINGGEENA